MSKSESRRNLIKLIVCAVIPAMSVAAQQMPSNYVGERPDSRRPRPVPVNYVVTPFGYLKLKRKSTRTTFNTLGENSKSSARCEG